MRLFVILIILVPLYSVAQQVRVVTLDEAITMALKQSDTLAGLRSAEKVSKQLVKETWRNYIPDISLTYGNNNSVALLEGDSRSQSLNMSLGYSIYTNGKTEIQTRMVKLESLLSGTDYKVEQNKINLTVTSKFYAIMKSTEEIKINQKLMESLLFQKKIINAEKKLGMATELQHVQVEARIKETEYQIMAAHNALKGQLKDLQILCGFHYKNSITIKGEIPDKIEYSLPEKPALVSIALKNRPEIKKNHLALLKATENLRLANYYYLPEIKLNGSCGLSGTTLPGDITWSVGVTLSTNLLGNTISAGQTFGESGSGNSRQSNTTGSASVMDKSGYQSAILQAQGGYVQALYESRNVKNAIALEVLRAWDALYEAQKMVKIAQGNMTMVSKQVEIEEVKAKLGEITRKDLFESLIQLSQAELRYNSSRIDHLISIAAFENALGYKIGTLRMNEGVK